MKSHALKPHAAMLGIALLSLSSCNFNLFDPLDSPTSDAQLISAARACFNKGDIACAQQNYEKLSGANADIKNSEEAFTTLESINAGMGAFIAAFGQSNINTGKALTSMANSIGSNASRANRVAVFGAYKKASLVVDTRLRGLSRFVTSLALGAEMLAENATVAGDLRAADLVKDVAGCKALGVGCAVAANGSVCDYESSSKKLQATGSGVAGADLEGVATTDVDVVNASLEVFNATINTLNSALSEMGVTSTDANISDFTSKFGPTLIQQNNGAAQADSPCYRQALLTQEIGR